MKKLRTGFGLSAIAAVLLMVFTVPSLSAQDYGDNYQDPPGRAGRVSFVNGAVSFQPGGEGDWVDAVPNRPLTTGDNLWADRDSRAEVQIGSTSIRLAPETSLTFLDLDNNVTQLRVSVGSVFFRVRHLDRDDSFEVDTPNLAFNVYQPGEYRVDVNENGDQTIARVFRGEAEITGGGDSYRLSEGQEGHFSGVDQLSYDVGGIGSGDDFEQWCLDRDRREDSFRSSQYVSTDMTGYEDLDQYGRWHEVEGYGNVWSPAEVSGDWAPYRNGNWVYISPWGWTWVEDEPWGFAPFHYGRWAYAGGGWCWVPGPVVARPIYSPALVAFVGGGGFSIGVGGGAGVGWFPLGPGEVYVPWYRTSPRYVQNVNVTNTHVTVVQVTNVYNNVTVNRVNNITYVNQRAGRGITVVNHDTFVNARPVNRNMERVDVRRISSAPVTHEVARNLQPSRESTIGNTHVVRTAPPAQVMSRPVVATREPVVRNRAAVPGGGRTAAPPPVRTVKPVPVSQAEALNRGAKGQTRGGRGGPAAAEANRPGAPGNQPGANNRPATPENRPGAGENRPGAPENRPGAPENRPSGAGNNGTANGRPETPRPGNPNRPADRGEANPRPGDGNPGNRPNGPANDTQPRPNNPDNNRPGRNVPRPPSAGGEQPDRGPGGAENRNSQPGSRPDNRPSNRPDNSRPDNVRPDNSPAARPDRGPGGAENRSSQPESRPDNRPSNRPDNSRPDNVRPDNPPPQPRASAPEERSAPAENRPAPRESRPSPPPENRREAAPPDTRETPSPRQESRPAPPPQSRPEARPSERPESKPQREEPRSNKNDGGNKDNRDNRDRNKFR